LGTVHSFFCTIVPQQNPEMDGNGLVIVSNITTKPRTCRFPQTEASQSVPTYPSAENHLSDPISIGATTTSLTFLWIFP